MITALAVDRFPGRPVYSPSFPFTINSYSIPARNGFGASASVMQYAVHPFPGRLILAWVIGYPVEMILAGVIIAEN